MFHSLRLLTRKAREIGFCPALGHATKMMYRKLFDRADLIFVLRSSDWHVAAPPWPPSFSVDPLYSLANLSKTDREILHGYGGNKVIESFATQFEHGGISWVGRINGQLAGVCWLIPASVASNYFFPLLEGDAVISNCFTIPRHRGKGIFSGILYHIAKINSKEELHRIFINCKIWNTPSIRGILKVGFEQIGVANSICILHRRIIIWQ
jgi:RimJ/RimL family protein N-acetyltransferase